MVVMIESPWRCDVTGNPVGTDTRMVGAPPCDCQGCRAEAAITSLSAERDALAKGIESWQEDCSRYAGEMSAISAAIGSVRFMDQPDGGDVSLAEQVSRMRQALTASEAEATSLRRKLEEHRSRPSYREVQEIVNNSVRWMQKAGESHEMLARHISEALDRAIIAASGASE